MTSIRLTRIEGPQWACGHTYVLRGNDVWAKADSVLRAMSAASPVARNDTDDVEYTVTYRNGDSYSGVYPLQHDDACDLARHLHGLGNRPRVAVRCVAPAISALDERLRAARPSEGKLIAPSGV